jgi:hypothetical protein
MMPDDHLGDALRSLAADTARTGRLTDAADLRHRGDVRRKRRHAATAALGIALVGLLTAGIAVARPNNRPQTGPPAGPPASGGRSTPAPVTPTASTAPPSTPVDTPPSDPSSAPPARTPTAGTTDPVLSGKREATIVRVQAFESGLSLLNGKLVEVDDDSGRQLFVPTPLGGDTYLIKAYDSRNGHPAADEPACWQVHNPHTTEPLTVQGAVCDAANPNQRFTITAKGKRTYAISNASAFLQYSPSSGLILEELGDAPLRSTYRFVDNGPARRPAGG